MGYSVVEIVAEILFNSALRVSLSSEVKVLVLALEKYDDPFITWIPRLQNYGVK